MEPNQCHLVLASGDFTNIAIILFVAIAVAVGILVASALLGPRRVGEMKHGTYESGMEPFSDTRRRFNVRFYLIAVLFLIFDVELLFLYPWAVLLPRTSASEDSPEYASVQAMVDAGYTGTYLLFAAGIFFVLLLVGFIYEWRKGVFKWN